MSDEMTLPTTYSITRETIDAAEKALASLGFPNQEPIKNAVELMIATAGLLADEAGAVDIATSAVDMVRDIVHAMAHADNEDHEEFGHASPRNFPGNSKTCH